MTTKVDTKAIRARADAATAGPWEEGISDAATREQQVARLAERLLAGPREVFPCVWVPTHPDTKIGDDPQRPLHAVVVCDTGNGPNGDANAAFIAASRTDVPALCDCFETLETELAERRANPMLCVTGAAAGPTCCEPCQLRARVGALERALRDASDMARDFLDVLDTKYAGQIERGDARPLREISQMTRALLEGES